jgi:hypothetical protein
LPPGDAIVFVAMDCGPVDIFLSFLKKLNNPFFFLAPPESLELELPALDAFFDSLVLNVLYVVALGEGDVTILLGEVRPAGFSTLVGAVFTDSGVWGVSLVDDSPTVARGDLLVGALPLVALPDC